MKLDKDERKISSMFDEIAPKYDFLNHFFTANSDKVWRRKIIKKIRKNNFSHSVIIDLASGTGDMTIELIKLNPEKIYAFDISDKMLEIQKQKISSEILTIRNASAENMPLTDNTVDIITIGFGVRNFENLDKCLSEINRVLKPGGLLIILEMFKQNKPNFLFNFYFAKIMPLAGRIISGSKIAYDYLHNSVQGFMTTQELTKLANNHNFILTDKTNNFLNFVYTLYFKKRD